MAAEAGVPPKHLLPRDLWRWEIALPTVADLGTVAQLTRVGLPALEPSRRQWALFQSVGEQLVDWPALVSASAARPEGRVLCVFRTARVLYSPRGAGNHPGSSTDDGQRPSVCPEGHAHLSPVRADRTPDV